MTILDVEALVAMALARSFAVGLVGAGRALVTVWSLRPPRHIAIRTARISDDARYAAFAKESSSTFFPLPPYV
jgi:steroid 5-alpha reductase family enzyme